MPGAVGGVRVKWKSNPISCGFALFPVDLADGTVIWLERFWHVRDGMCSHLNFASWRQAEEFLIDGIRPKVNLFAPRGVPPDVRG